ncbi:DUF402 domain-containing protein [Fictibacillus iocasae]|uniref:DUF402 domain-containing protein n=1 Tax=Fictibacillus iocasae TaxID=2715437 RepID=A0ABW2NIW5_9BACL
MEKKSGSHNELTCVTSKRYAQTFIDEDHFKGYITLIEVLGVTEPLYKRCGETEHCVIDEGYMVLQQFPHQEHHTVTTMFNEKGEVIQWYIDVCADTGVKDGIPYMKDLYLDIVVLPSGEVIRLDADELEEAYEKGKISEELYKLAWEESDKLYQQCINNQFSLLNMVHEHKDQLSGKLL